MAEAVTLVFDKLNATTLSRRFEGFLSEDDAAKVLRGEWIIMNAPRPLSNVWSDPVNGKYITGPKAERSFGFGGLFWVAGDPEGELNRGRMVDSWKRDDAALVDPVDFAEIERQAKTDVGDLIRSGHVYPDAIDMYVEDFGERWPVQFMRGRGMQIVDMADLAHRMR